MKPFLEGSACFGKRPHIISSEHRISRPRLVRAMLASRTVERRIVAPVGFGRTSVAAEYARTVFGFRDTFWINGASVCFLRDLDAGTMAQKMLKFGGDRWLVVFDDVPLMYDSQRRLLFDQVVETLLEAGWEVVTVSVPGNPAVQRPGSDCITLTAADLLADADEMQMYASEVLMRGSSAMRRWQDDLRDRLGVAGNGLPHAQREDADSMSVLLGSRRAAQDPVQVFAGRASATPDLPQSRCVPALIWGEEKDVEKFWQALREARFASDGTFGCEAAALVMPDGGVSAGMPDAATARLQLALATMMVLQKGTFDEVADVVGHMGADTWRALARDYPFVGVDVDDETFSSVPLTPQRVRGVFGSHLTEIGAASPSKSSDTWATKLAEHLMGAGRVALACDVMVHLCLRKKRIAWLEGRQEMLTAIALLDPVERVFESTYRPTGSMSVRLLAGAAVRELVLGAPQQAATYGLRAARSSTAPAFLCCVAAAVVALTGSGEASQRARRLLREYASLSAWEGEALGTDLQPEDVRGLAAVASLILAADQAPVACADMLARRQTDIQGSRMAVLLTAELAEKVLDVLRVPGGVWMPDDACAFFGVAAELLALVRQQGHVDLAQARLAMVLGVAHSQGLLEGSLAMGGRGKALGASSADRAVTSSANRTAGPRGERGEVSSADCAVTSAEQSGSLRAEGTLQAAEGSRDEDAARVEQPGTQRSEEAYLAVAQGQERRLVSLIVQQRASWREHRARLGEAKGTQTPARQTAAGVDPRIPPVTVSLFGSMTVCVGDAPVDQRRFVKQKARMLFAVMAVNNGKEMSRRQLVGLVWPEGFPHDASGYFYSCLSLVRKALGGNAKYCPYVVQHQYGCMLDARYVQTDMEEFNALCRELMNGEPDVDRWTKIGFRIEESFSAELLPSLPDTPFIVGMREECRRRLTDSLVRASNVLCDANEGQAALRMAQLAFKQGLRREDMFQALMRSHALNGQREQGLAAYAACCRYLEDELGLRPTARTLKLYRDLLVCGDDGSLGTAGLQGIS